MLLEARDLSATRTTESGTHVVLDGVDLGVEAGTLTDVVGPSGSGKTTLLLALARLLPGATGVLELDGVAAERIPPQRWRRDVALLPQVPALVPGSVGDNLLLPWRLRVRSHETPPSAEVLARALADVGLADVGLERDPSRLSVGQIARVALLRVLLTRPRVLLADEPDAALDDVSAAQVTRMTEAFVAEGGAVVRVRHLRLDERADRRFRLEGGKLSEVADA
ncbi:MAG TPA: ATP-binding cassette domain-containing protein [Coriobacteriia bacterium]|jgi:putative ABC transport system ATP-binding protein